MTRAIRWLIAALGLLALAGAAWWAFGRPVLPPGPAEQASPALWRIERDGRAAYLFGTFHAVPAGDRWLTPAIAHALARSDRLVLEVTGLEDERRDGRIFERLARSPGLPPLARRLPGPAREALADLARQQPMLDHGLDGYESWAAALLIGARAGKGEDARLSTRHAPEEVLAAAMRARGRPVTGLETIAGQLGLFDAMAEPLQRRFLANAVLEAREGERLFGAFHQAWAHGDMASLERFYAESFQGEDALRAVLVDNRNRRWVAQIDAMMRGAQGTTPFIAVGAGHFVGPAGLPSLLARQGWHITRIR